MFTTAKEVVSDARLGKSAVSAGCGGCAGATACLVTGCPPKIENDGFLDLSSGKPYPASVEQTYEDVNHLKLRAVKVPNGSYLLRENNYEGSPPFFTPYRVVGVETSVRGACLVEVYRHEASYDSVLAARQAITQLQSDEEE